jgi:DtxR family Mn-dependent transcriptional regulator
MDNHNLLSESEEMYLVGIAQIIEDGPGGPTRLSRLAEHLNIQPVSVNQMVRRLEKCGLVAYLPYRGVLLTENGSLVAGQVLRRRRLWEVFLVEQLGISLAEAESMACRLEHDIPVETGERLAKFLGFPEHSPRGKNIPPAELGIALPDSSPLSSQQVEGSYVVIRVECRPAERAFLSGAGIAPGKTVRLLGIVQGSRCLAQSEGHEPVQFSEQLAQKIWVQPI